MTENNDGGQQGYTPPATQEELNKLITDRVARERAKYADYEDLKKAKDELDQLRNASKSDLEKAIARAEAAEAKIKAFETRDQIIAWKTDIAKEHDVPVDALAGSSKEELTAHAEVLKKLLPEAPKSPVILGQERAPSNVSVDESVKFVDGFFK